MTSDEPAGPAAPPAGSTPAPEPPDVQSLLQRYRSVERDRRRRRRRLLVLAAGGVVAACAVVVGLLSMGPSAPREEASPASEPLAPQVAAPAREIDERRPRASPPAIPEPKPPVAGPTASPVPEPKPPAIKPPAPATPEARPPAAKPLAPPPPAEARPSVARQADRPTAPAAPAPTSASPTVVAVRHQPRERLATVKPGDAKERVFELFGSTVERRNGTLVRVEGMRLRASGRSAEHARVEVAEVEVGDGAAGQRYWFLFGDGRLLVWGRPDEWPAAVARYQLEIDYR
jgi:hypothetical protein